MEGKNNTKNRHFLIRQSDLERMLELKEHPFYKQRIKQTREHIDPHIKEPVKPWDGTDWRIRPTLPHKQLPLYLLDAATLYLISGEEDLAQACHRDVMTCVQVSEGNQEQRMSAASLQEMVYNVSIIFIHEWLSEYFADEERARIRKASLGCIHHHAGEIARFTVQNKIIQNHILHDSFGLSMVALYFNDFADSDRWISFATDTAVKYLQEAFNEDGAQNEVTGSYHSGCVRDAVHFAQIMRDFADRDLMQEDWYLSIIKGALEWLGSLVTPQGTLVAFNDSTDTVAQWYFRLGASLFKNQHFQALADIINRTETRSLLLYDLL